MGNMFGTSSSVSSGPGNSNFVATGQSVYSNSNGETVHDTFRHVNGEFTRETATSNVPLSTGFLQPQNPANIPWLVPVAGTIMLLLFIAMFLYSRQAKRSVKRTTVVKEDAESGISGIPLYALNNKTRPPHASDAMWNIDLLDN